MTPPTPPPAVKPGKGPAGGANPAITSAELYEWLARRRKTQRKVTIAALVLIAVVVSAGAVYFTAFSRQLVAMNHLRSIGFSVDWDLDWSKVGRGGVAWVTFRPERWSQDQALAPGDLESLKSLNHVVLLDLSNLIRLRDDDFAVLAALGEIEDLELNRNVMSGTEVLRRIPGVSGPGGRPVVELTDRVLDHVQHLTRLKTLGLAGNRITDAGLAKLANLRSLELLDLDGTDLTNAGLDALAGLKSLKTLRIQNTRVTKRGVARFRLKRVDVEVTHEPDFDEGPNAIEGDRP